jgi:hypothetical protein
MIRVPTEYGKRKQAKPQEMTERKNHKTRCPKMSLNDRSQRSLHMAWLNDLRVKAVSMIVVTPSAARPLYCPAVPHLDRFHAPLGLPSYSRPEKDNLEFRLESGKDLSDGRSFRSIRKHDQWQLANCVFKKGGPLVVSDARGKGVYKTWRVQPTSDPDFGNGVILHPLHEGLHFFRGDRAFATEPLIMATSMRPLIAHISGHETFNRVSAAAGTGKGWGDISRDTSLFHNYGFIKATGVKTVYEIDSPEVLAMRSEKDREQGLGGKMNYEKTDTWPKLVEQFEEMLAAKANRVEVEV